MKLRNKILLVICLVWALFIALTYTGSRYFLIRNFITLEQDQTNRDLSRIDQALNQINHSLYTFTADWSHWNDLYSYVQGKNPQFAQNNFHLAAFINSNINLLTYWDNQGKPLLGVSIDTEHGKFAPYPAGIDQYIYPGSPLLNQNDLHSYIQLPSGIMMIATSSITDGNKHLPKLGTTIAGRYLSAPIIQNIINATKHNVELITLDQINNNTDFKNAYRIISTNQTGHLSHTHNDKTVEGFTLIQDINGKPIAMLRMTKPRSIYMTEIKEINYYLISLILLGILFSLLMVQLINKLIINRLETLNKKVMDISATHALSLRVNDLGKDEISSLSTQINRMLAIVEFSHTKLEQRVEERTQELQTSNQQLQLEIAERKTVEMELITHKDHLVRLAHYDSLTSLPNRVFFNEMLNKAISHANRHNKMLAVLFIDLDRFKNINDALGHNTGDQVLKEIAVRFSTTLRADDVLARLGGDEFIILLTDMSDPKFARTVAEKIIHACSKPVIINHHEFFLTASVGICIFPDDGQSLEDLQKNADMAMYQAKQVGGGSYHYFTQTMNDKAHEQIKIEAALRKAIKNNEFILHYQPKYNLSDGMIIGVEALIRWESPELGMMSPAKFIPIAEETGLIIPIGDWALLEACRANKSWQDQGLPAISVAVNLSPKQFRHQDIAQVISSALSITGLSTDYLELEITETAIMDNIETAVSKLTSIKNMGVKISIDDFGTGYTSISYLKEYPVNILKIDQIFIKGIPSDQNDVAITSAIIALAHNLGMKVVAEGVETAEQLQFLADHDCDMVQGYFMSRPLSEQKLITQLLNILEQPAI